jgi:hypothetical protein
VVTSAPARPGDEFVVVFHHRHDGEPVRYAAHVRSSTPIFPGGSCAYRLELVLSARAETAPAT